MKYLLIVLVFLIGCSNPKKEIKVEVQSENETQSQSVSPQNQILNSYKDIIYPEFNYVSPYPGDYRTNLSDSITLYAVRDTAVPLIDLTIYFKENAIPKNREEIAKLILLSSLYTKGGTESLSPAQVDDSLEFLSAKISAGMSSDYSVAHLNCLSRDFDKVLPLFFDLLNKPNLDSARLELSKNSAIQNYLHRFDQPSHQLGALSAKVAYKDNPKLWRADSADFASVKRADLLALKDEFFVPNKVIIAAAGDFNTDSLKIVLTKLFENWKKGKGRAVESPLEFKDEIGIFASEKNITQANIMMEMPFVKRPHPDYYPAAIASYILGGGSFSSRLMTKIRTERGLAYSIYSYAKSDYEDIGYTGVTLQTSVDSAKVALQLIKEECQKLGSQGPTDEELAFAKKSLIESIPTMFENAEVTANTFAVSELNGRTLEHFKEYPNKLNAVTKEQVKAMTAKYFNPSQFKYSIVAPTEKLGLENVKIIPLDSLDF